MDKSVLGKSSGAVGHTRRKLLGTVAKLSLSGVALTQLPACAKRVDSSATKAEFFSPEQMRLLSTISELIIPTTDTPGAQGAGVPEKLDNMMAHWASADTQALWVRVLDRINAASKETYRRPFLSLDHAKQYVLLRMFDKKEMGTDGNEYREVKGLIVTAYYQSEIGATQELRFELIPGAYYGCVPFAEIGRTWAA